MSKHVLIENVSPTKLMEYMGLISAVVSKDTANWPNVLIRCDVFDIHVRDDKNGGIFAAQRQPNLMDYYKVYIFKDLYDKMCSK